jgi:hypothetical protein
VIRPKTSRQKTAHHRERHVALQLKEFSRKTPLFVRQRLC